MARPRKNSLPGFGGSVPAHLAAWAEQLGEALGRGVARGINSGLGALNPAGLTGATGRRGRPPKPQLYPVPADRRCKADKCTREARSKGLCSAHYQAERRNALKGKAAAGAKS